MYYTGGFARSLTSLVSLYCTVSTDPYVAPPPPKKHHLTLLMAKPRLAYAIAYPSWMPWSTLPREGGWGYIPKQWCTGIWRRHVKYVGSLSTNYSLISRSGIYFWCSAWLWRFATSRIVIRWQAPRGSDISTSSPFTATSMYSKSFQKDQMHWIWPMRKRYKESKDRKQAS
jgi:hypothetical protein